MIRILFFALMFCFILSSQNRKDNIYFENNGSHQLYFSVTPSKLASFEKEIPLWLISILSSYDYNIQKGIVFSDDYWDYLTQSSIELVGHDRAVTQLKTIFKLNLELPNDDLKYLAEMIQSHADIQYCSLVATSPIAPPMWDIPPTTPLLQSSQTYLNSNPGMNVLHMWNNNINGSTIKIRNIEYGFNKNHEEFHQTNINLATGTTIHPSASVEFTEHGTATFGVVFGHNGSYGVAGIAHGSPEVLLFPEWQIATGYNRILAVTSAIQSSVAGDVIIYEMQTGGVGGSTNYVPAEFNQVVWDLTLAATNSGIIIVAAAGNGDQNLDAPAYQSYMDRGNSGAIIVGGGTSNLAHNRIYYSTYGSRVDVQGWSQNVLTTGAYPNLITHQYGNDFNQSYMTYSGTSSATAMVAPAAALVLDYYKSLNNNELLTGPQLRTILQQTGHPQGAAVFGNIGPLPNLQEAANAVSTLSRNQHKQLSWYVYPNPTNNFLNIYIDNNIQITDYQILDINGKQVVSGHFKQQVDVSLLPNGLYFLKLISSDNVYCDKFIKK